MGHCLFMRKGEIHTVPCKYKANLADNTWGMIAEYAPIAAQLYEAGTPFWNIGDEKQITLTTGEVITVQIAGFNHDYTDIPPTSGGSGVTIPISFVMKDCLNQKQQMNGTDTNSGGYWGSGLKDQLVGTIYNTLPSDLKAVMKSAYKYMVCDTMLSAPMPIWCLAEAEVFDEPYYAGEGSKYPLFNTADNRIKKVSGTTAVWWLRSKSSSNTTLFRTVSTDGSVSTASASSMNGVCFGFCI